MDKTYILQEIRRTSEANGGKPLGVLTFQQQTGIKKSDWQKFWPRLSEAYVEAGYTPNELTRGYKKDAVLKLYAELALEWSAKRNCLPTENDLRFKANNDPKFPSSKTIIRCLGSKEEAVRKLLGYCQSQSGYEGVARLCNEFLAKQNDAPRGNALEKVVMGFVYLFKSGRYYKIGKTNAVGRRQYELGIQLPEKMKTIHVIRTDDPTGIEEYWFKRFAEKRKGGEWFDLDAADIAAFRRRKFM